MDKGIIIAIILCICCIMIVAASGGGYYFYAQDADAEDTAAAEEMAATKKTEDARTEAETLLADQDAEEEDEVGGVAQAAAAKAVRQNVKSWFTNNYPKWTDDIKDCYVAMRNEKCDTKDEHLVYFGPNNGYRCFNKSDVNVDVWPRAVNDVPMNKQPQKVFSARTAETLCDTTTDKAFEAYSAAYKGPADEATPGEHFSVGLLDTVIDGTEGLRDNYAAYMD